MNTDALTYHNSKIRNTINKKYYRRYKEMFACNISLINKEEK